MKLNTPDVPTQIELFLDRENSLLLYKNETIKLDPLIARLLGYFLQNNDKTISRDALIEDVWQSNHVSDDALNRCISVLRKILSSERTAFITTVPKVGYRFSLPENVTLLQQIKDVTPQQHPDENAQQPNISEQKKTHALRPAAL